MPSRRTVHPHPANVIRFIEEYVRTRDLEKSSLRSGFEAEAGKKLYANKRIRAEIDRKIAVIERETAKLIAKANHLQAELIDSELVNTIKIKASRGNAMAKIKAMELGYERLGVLRNGAFTEPTDKPNAAPSVYRALTMTVRQTTTTEVTEKHELKETPAHLALPAPGKNQEIEILDYNG